MYVTTARMFFSQKGQFSDDEHKQKQIPVPPKPVSGARLVGDQQTNFTAAPRPIVIDDNLIVSKWLWHSDRGWEEYSAQLSEILEKAFKANQAQVAFSVLFYLHTKVKIDADRFVNLKHMVQQRFDDPNKKRLEKNQSFALRF